MRRRLLIGSAFFFALATSAHATHFCTSPLVLDMDLDGLGTASTNPTNGVEFDINGDGVDERIGWPLRDAFLWIDVNDNGTLDDGTELFGTSTRLPNGEFAQNGFEALQVHDWREFGGDEDGRITKADEVWRSLRLWVDGARDGVPQDGETFALDARGLLWIDLVYEIVDEKDGGGNLHAFRSRFGRVVRGSGKPSIQEFSVDDIFFAIQE